MLWRLFRKSALPLYVHVYMRSADLTCDTSNRMLATAVEERQAQKGFRATNARLETFAQVRSRP